MQIKKKYQQLKYLSGEENIDMYHVFYFMLTEPKCRDNVKTQWKLKVIKCAKYFCYSEYLGHIKLLWHSLMILSVLPKSFRGSES